MYISRNRGDRVDVLDEVHEMPVGLHGHELRRPAGGHGGRRVGIGPRSVPAALRRVHVLRSAVELRRRGRRGHILPEGAVAVVSPILKAVP